MREQDMQPSNLVHAHGMFAADCIDQRKMAVVEIRIYERIVIEVHRRDVAVTNHGFHIAVHRYGNRQAAVFN